MRLWIASDLHLEFYGAKATFELPDADVFVCAGDVLDKGIVPSLEWLAETIAPTMQVVCVAGNHEFYRASMVESIRAAKEAALRYPNVHFLENDAVVIDGLRFLGTTLWTDFRLMGDDTAPAMYAAKAGMKDYKKIKFSKTPYQAFKPLHAYRKHQEARLFLSRALSENYNGKTVVVSHHAPSARSISAESKQDLLSAAYASDMEALILEYEPALWVHGHVHHLCDYMINGTRVACNPMGYPDEKQVVAFNPRLTIEV
ncbi:metallophosphoesterase [Rhizobium fabae]|uniref:Icc-related predicted phosphoesterase n=1 Tax=Rhizobium fabae TaxID=573179 RepID=A0A7W6FI64_9HYPH|nr:metallophosphoesterase [Rhizobium fabae]MBB3914600.1 Icc-related predicted phosphoesterase [Rhizobium fabae]RUM14490.1 phosphatase [Rhizobium fabae]